MNKYARHIEVKAEDMSAVVSALTKTGYQCLVTQDGESMDYFSIDILHPEFECHWFEEFDDGEDELMERQKREREEDARHYEKLREANEVVAKW